MTPFDPAVLADRKQLRDELLDERLAGVDQQSLRWLALLPEWTGSLARAAGFPGAAADLEPLLRQAERAGLCEVLREDDLSGEETVRFWMPPGTRASLLERWQMEGSSLGDDVNEIAQSILSVRGSDPTLVSSGVSRWAELATRELTTTVATGELLGQEVTLSLDDGDIGRAGEWVFAGETLGEALGAQVTTAASRGMRQLGLHYRGMQDALYLRNFVERAEQAEELRDLLEPGGHWAVHFIGQSGVGKTMLMRYLTSRDPDAPIASPARIDFDYIDPRFPLERPARLLYELGVELAADLSDGTQEGLFRSFLDAVTESERTPVDPGSQGSLQALETEELEEVVASFARFVTALPPPVVLILDTCEELAKLHPAGDEVPSIAATFRILERVHEAAPSTRAIFAGRRWLTPEAANLVRTKAMPGSIMSMEKRPYMRMHEVRGFTRDEVVRYLRKVCDRDLSGEMLETVLEVTVDPGSVPSFGDSQQATDEPRFNPTDTALVGDWLASRPDLTPADLAGGNLDAYVEQRILGRLRDSPEVVAAIPAAILLERFDSATIWPALAGDAEARSRALNGLLEQEWTHLEGGRDPEEIVIQIDRGLLPRLLGYYAREPERERVIGEARATLIPHLGKMMEEAPSRATPDTVEAALRLLPAEEAARRFDRLADRVAAESAWAWAESLCSRLLSPERNSSLYGDLAPSVSALYVASLRHRSASVNLLPLWRVVAEGAERHPDPLQRMVLEARAGLGELVVAAANGGFDEGEAARVLQSSADAMDLAEPSSPIAAAVLAAVEALVDANEVRGYALPHEALRACFQRLFPHFAADEALLAYVFALEGRMEALRGDTAAARDAFDRVEEMDLGPGLEGRGFADWVPPASVPHRVLLELLRFRLAHGEGSGGLLDRCEGATMTASAGTDAVQLLSLVLQVRLGNGGVNEAMLAFARDLEVIAGEYQPVAPVHRVTPPLFVSVAEAWLAQGRASRALELLDGREQLAASRPADQEMARAAALATLRVLRRLRLDDRPALITSQATADDRQLRHEALAAAALISGLQARPGYGTWQARNLLGASDVDEEPGAMPPTRLSPPVPQPRLLHSALDRMEGELVRRQSRARRPQSRASRRARHLVEMTDLSDLGPTVRDPLGIEALRIRLRVHALTSRGLDLVPSSPPPGPRLLGEVALEEGELLALRLPRQAIPLLRLAEESLGRAGDTHGAFAAALRLAIAEVHAGMPEQARQLRVEVLQRYEEACRVDDQLPRYTGPPFVLEGRDDKPESAWRGWLLRLSRYLEWCEPGGVGVVPQSDGEATLAHEPELTLVPATRESESSEVLEPGSLAVPPVQGLDISIALGRSISDTPHVEAEIAPRQSSRLGAAAFRVLRLLGTRSLVARFPVRERIGESPSALASSLRSRLETPGMPIRLDVAPDLAELSWEQRLLGHLIFDPDWDPAQMPSIWRIRPLGLGPLPSQGWAHPISAVCSPSWRPLIASEAGVHAGRLIDWANAERNTTEAPSRAAIALGSPVMSHMGWRLRLDDDDLSRLGEPSKRSYRPLVSPDELAREAPIVVIVGRPGGSRLVVDRRAADGLRGFAHEAFLAGARAVITIPVLPPQRAAAAIGVVTTAISDWDEPPDLENLRALAGDLRTHLYRPGEAQSKTAEAEEERRRTAELALDVCLFAPR